METLLFEIAQALWWPVITLVFLALVYAVMQLGRFTVEMFQRWRQPAAVLTLAARLAPDTSLPSIEAMELSVLRELEGLRLCSRITPMLGLVATMIPLGPALAAVASGKADAAIGDLSDAFATVIVALAAASITFLIHTVRRRWLMQELTQLIDKDVPREATR